MKIARLTVSAAFMAAFLFPAQAHDDGRYANSPLKEWFNGLANRHKVPCCSMADGLSIKDIDWDTDGRSYRVRLEGEWIAVPDDALITEPNRLGPAVVWPFSSGGKTYIRCFMPGALT